MLLGNPLVFWLAVSPNLWVDPGPVNRVEIQQAGHRLAVYRAPRADAEMLLLTDHRRDVIGTPAPGMKIAAPAAERDRLERAPEFWSRFTQERFHDYEARATKLPVEAVRAARWVVDGEVIDFHGLAVRVISTPGYTPGAVSYATFVDGRHVIFSGDLIFGDGQVLDLYSLQNAIPETNTRGYHGFAARAGQLMASLRRIRAEKPDLLVPARGPVIRDPAAALDKLLTRLEAFFREHFSTDALRWYWGDDHLRKRSRPMLGDSAAIDWMPVSEQRKLPEWIIPIQNSRLVISASGGAYLIDCGNAKIAAEVKRLQQSGRFQKLEGIFITHYHDDHTDFAEQAARDFGVTIEYTPIQGEVLEQPHAFRLPAMTAHPISSRVVRPNGFRRKWREFDLTFLDYPGQTLYHSALLLEGRGERIFFIGDSFTPSGLDDYCLQNRNLLNPDQGYLRCLRTLRGMNPAPWLINQHVEPMFRFAPANLDRLEQSLARRNGILRELIALPHPNYGIDENWASIYPYAVSARPGESLALEIRLTRHSPEPARIVPHVPAGWKVETNGLKFRVTPPPGAAGLHIITADVAVGPWIFEHFAEALVTVNK